MKSSTFRTGMAAFAVLTLFTGCSRQTGAPPSSNPTMNTNMDASARRAQEMGKSEIQSPRQDSWTFDAMPTPAPSVTPKRRLNEITFSANSVEYGSEGAGVCREAAEMLKASPNMKILLLGYCHRDEKVGSGSNDLGLRRAEKVKACLKSNGVNVAGFETASFGSRYSAADRTAPMTMEQERRVEMWVLAP